MTLAQILALVGTVLVCVIVFFSNLYNLITAYHSLNLEQLGQPKFWIPEHECMESHGINWQPVIFIGGIMPTMEEGLSFCYRHAGKIAC